MKPCLCVNDHQEEISFSDCLHHLPADFQVHRNTRIVSNAARIHEPELSPTPFGHGEMTIARRSRLLAHDCTVIANDPVEQRRLSDVGPPDDCNDWNVYTGHAATAS